MANSGLCRLLALIGLVAVQGALATNTSTASAASPIKREILALYDGSQEKDPELTRIHRFAELPLNHLGFIVRYRDVRDALPELGDVQHYRGVLTWFGSSVPKPDAYLSWALKVSKLDMRYVVLGDPGVVPNSANIIALNRVLALAGVHHTGEYVSPTLGSTVRTKDRSLIGFECELDPALPDYPVVQANSPRTKVALRIEASPREGARFSDVVSIGPRGGYAAFNYEFCYPWPSAFSGKWLINPFQFFAETLGYDGSPIPDTTTLSGRRIYLSTIDADGWNRPSKIASLGKQLTAGAVVTRELVGPGDDLPSTLNMRDNGFGHTSASANSYNDTRQARLSAFSDLCQACLRRTLSRFDLEYPSISNVTPLLTTGPARLINEPMSDDGYYPAPAGESAFAEILETIRNTASPHRLIPVSLNYHAYAGEYPASLQSLKDILAGVRELPLAPISASDYAAIVNGFFQTQVTRLSADSWRIDNRGSLQTVRFDEAPSFEVDLSSSLGVIGQKREGRSLYVALDSDTKEAIVSLRSAIGDVESAYGPLLVESRWPVHALSRGACELAFDTHGYGKGSFTWSHFRPALYLIDADVGGVAEARMKVSVGHGGWLTFELPLTSAKRTHVVIRASDCKGDD